MIERPSFPVQRGAPPIAIAGDRVIELCGDEVRVRDRATLAVRSTLAVPGARAVAAVGDGFAIEREHQLLWFRGDADPTKHALIESGRLVAGGPDRVWLIDQVGAVAGRLTGGALAVDTVVAFTSDEWLTATALPDGGLVWATPAGLARRGIAYALPFRAWHLAAAGDDRAWVTHDRTLSLVALGGSAAIEHRHPLAGRPIHLAAEGALAVVVVAGGDAAAIEVFDGGALRWTAALPGGPREVHVAVGADRVVAWAGGELFAWDARSGAAVPVPLPR